LIERRDSTAFTAKRDLEKFQHGTHRKDADKRLQEASTLFFAVMFIIAGLTCCRE
jgi:hypothetical protein